MEAILKGLNAAQRAAVTSPASVLQVLAPPGSGKTKTLTSRVAFLLSHHGYAPWNVICCTFTIKASKEMRERLRGIVGCDLESKLVLGTFHSICRKYLITYGHLIGIPRNFGIADSSDSLSILKRAAKRLKLGIDPKAARARISHRKARGHRIDDLSNIPQKTVDGQEFVTIYQEYEKALETSNLLDYDDLLLRCTDLLKAHPRCVSNVEALLIDEFQDTNIIQFELMKLLASAKNRVTVVGDPDQSIYGFRSAEVENLRRMRAYYPDSLVINLEENYRSSAAVLRLAQDVIEQDTSRPDKKLKATHCYGTLPVLRRVPNPHEEALWIVSEIKRMTAMTGGLLKYSDFAILLRSAFLSLLIEKALGNAGIPYRMVGGHRFFDRVEVRLVIDYLRTISQPDNNSALLSIINVPSRKLGETTIKDLVRIGEENKLSLWATVQKVLSGGLSMGKKLPKPAEDNLRKFVSLMTDARKKMTSMAPADTPRLLVELIVSAIDLKQYLKSKYEEDHDDRWENVQELVTQAADIVAQQRLAVDESLPEIKGLEQREVQNSEEVLGRFLANIVLSTEVESSEAEQNQHRVTISTMHSAKGLEWPVVFIPAAYEGSIPHSRAEDTDEERRLLYVAMTRAQALLTLSFPLLQSRDQSESILSQFLPLKVHQRFSQTGPEFNEMTVKDLASILRREYPSEEDLAEGLQTLTDKESTYDDIWPADGGHRQRNDWLQNDSSGQFSTMGTSKSFTYNETGVKFSGTVTSLMQNYNSSLVGGDRRFMNTAATSMGCSSSFSISNTSTGFTTAKVQLKANEVTAERKVATYEPSSAKISVDSAATTGRGNIPKIDPKQGSISGFFSQGTSKPCVQPPFPSAGRPVSTWVLKAVDPCPTKASPSRDDTQIPGELSSHRIPAKIAPIKRPRAVMEETTSPNRKHYPFLSSSPTREVESLPAEPISICKNQSYSLKTHLDPIARHHHDGGVLKSAPTAYTTNFTKPATTLHTTSMAALQQSASTRKTLGVRRGFNGWENRRNK